MDHQLSTVGAQNSNTRFLLHLASVAVPAFASLVLYVKCLSIVQEVTRKTGEREPWTNVGVLLRALREPSAQPFALGLIVAQAFLLVAFVAWVS